MGRIRQSLLFERKFLPLLVTPKLGFMASLLIAIANSRCQLCPSSGGFEITFLNYLSSPTLEAGGLRRVE